MYISVNHYITDDDREKWEKYITSDPANYIHESFQYMEEVNTSFYELPAPVEVTNVTDVLLNRTQFPIFMYSELGYPVEDPGPGPYMVRYIRVFFVEISFKFQKFKSLFVFS